MGNLPVNSAALATDKQEKHQINLTISGVASFPFARWQQQFAIACLVAGFEPPNLAFPWGVRDPHLTQCVTGPRKCTCQMTC